MRRYYDIPVIHYICPQNACKYPLMRKMLLEDPRPPAELVMWFDDDSYLDGGEGLVAAGAQMSPQLQLAARIVLGRMQFSHGAIPDPCPSRVNAQREAAMLARMVAFFRAQDVRVVNMSWGRPESGFLGELERCAPELSATERAAIARYAVDTLRRTMIAGMRASPRILFVAAAGNAGNNTEFNDFALRIDLPNMLLVGAVDRAGDEASFTNTGPLVRLYANGYLVETRVPGGGTEASSGTSFAAPGVVNTVAKMLAVNPTLSTTQVLETLLRTAEVRGSRGLRVMHPAKAVAEARSQR